MQIFSSLMSIEDFSVCSPHLHLISTSFHFILSVSHFALPTAVFKTIKDVPVNSHNLCFCTYQGLQQDQVDHEFLVSRPYQEAQVVPENKQEILFDPFHLLVPFLQVSLAYPHPLKQNHGKQFLNSAAQRDVM